MPDLLPILFLLGAAQGGFLAFALLTHRGGNRRANRYLACYMLVFVAALIDYFLDAAGLTPHYVWLRTLIWPKEFFYGVLIFLYCRELTAPGRPLKPWLVLLLWVPPLLHCAVTWPLLWLPGDLQYQILLNVEGLPPLYNAWRLLLGDVELFITIVHLSVFLLICLRMVIQHRKRLEHAYSNLDRIGLNWLRNLLIGTLCVYGLWLAEEFFSEDLLAGREWLDVLLGLSMVVLIYTMGLLGLRQPQIFVAERNGGESASGAGQAEGNGEAAAAARVRESGGPGYEEVSSNQATPSAKYARSALSPDLAASLVQELEQLMATRAPHLNPDLSLSELAATLSVSTNYLSQAINQQLDMNFFDFVNSYRVGSALPLLAGTDRTILDVAMESGFNSKSAFYAAFRKHQGMTPGAYRKEGARLNAA
ncbi:MAG: AraC family transcriptional regulator [Pseudomonadota bacterium]